jgi:hypothetical protein
MIGMYRDCVHDCMYVKFCVCDARMLTYTHVYIYRDQDNILLRLYMNDSCLFESPLEKQCSIFWYIQYFDVCVNVCMHAYMYV